jgi:hypothetical protein
MIRTLLCGVALLIGSTLSAAPHKPGHSPGHSPGHTPGHSPGHNPGHHPGHTPGHNPGHPGHTPGHNPGHYNGHHPGGPVHNHGNFYKGHWHTHWCFNKSWRGYNCVRWYTVWGCWLCWCPDMGCWYYLSVDDIYVPCDDLTDENMDGIQLQP